MIFTLFLVQFSTPQASQWALPQQPILMPALNIQNIMVKKAAWAEGGEILEIITFFGGGVFFRLVIESLFEVVK